MWDEVGVGRFAEQAVSQVQGRGLGGMTLSASNSKETEENSKFKLTSQAIMEVYLSR